MKLSDILNPFSRITLPISLGSAFGFWDFGLSPEVF
jgi:hypothetical protein